MQKGDSNLQHKIDVAITAGSLLTLGILVTGAFSTESKDIIKHRARGQSELSGYNLMSKEAAHLNHSKDIHRRYDDPKNALYVTTFEHYVHHAMHQGKAGEIGLTENNNNFAVRDTLKRVYNWYAERGLELTPQMFENEYEIAYTRWNSFYSSLRYREG